MRFKVGDKVKIIDGRKTPSDIIWIARMDNLIGKVGEVSRVEEGWGYTVCSCGTEFWYDEEWLTPAPVTEDIRRKVELVKDDGVRAVLVPTVFTPKRIYKGKGKTVDRETAERCLKILEWYCNDNGVFPIADRDSDGVAHFKFERRLREL